MAAANNLICIIIVTYFKEYCLKYLKTRINIDTFNHLKIKRK